MIKIIEKDKCCGCGACASICRKHSIQMIPDNEGFLYPHVNSSTCVECGLCENVCNELHPYESRTPLNAFVAINQDYQIRLKSSSGGIFYMLAERVINNGGVVFGARFDEKWQVVIDYVEDMKGVEAFMGSKYVQARVDTAYVDVKRFLSEGRKVLFSGTPCQIAGLYHFLSAQYDNLLTVDVICHGSPSPRVWGLYLEEVVANGRKAINDCCFRNNRNGWRAFNFSMEYDAEGQTIFLCSHRGQNLYMQAFLSDLILRPSCHNCQAKSGRGHSDITLADFWGIDAIMPDMDDDKGASLVLVNTDKGASAFDWNKITRKDTVAEVAILHNSAYYRSAHPHRNRTEFFAHLSETDNVNGLIMDCLKPTFSQWVCQFRVKCKQSIKSMLKLVGGGHKCKSIEHPHPSISDNVSVVAIDFRNKEQGWKKYGMKIVLKENKI